MALRGHQRERLGVGVQDEDAGGQLDPAPDGQVKQGDVAGVDGHRRGARAVPADRDPPAPHPPPRPPPRSVHGAARRRPTASPTKPCAGPPTNGPTLARRRLLHGRAADILIRRHERDPATTRAATVAYLQLAGRDADAAQWRWRAAEVGIRQFLDIGTGLPTIDCTHEIAQQVAPESRIVYVDNDPVVLLHAHALLRSTPQGATDYLDADLRDPGAIIAGAAKTLDLTQPVAVMFLGVLGHVTDDGQAQSIVRVLMDAVPSGSFLVLSDGTNVVYGSQGQAAQDDYNDSGRGAVLPAQPRADRPVLRRAGPGGTGVVSCPRWRPPASSLGGSPPAEIDAFCGVGRKP